MTIRHMARSAADRIGGGHWCPAVRDALGGLLANHGVMHMDGQTFLQGFHIRRPYAAQRPPAAAPGDSVPAARELIPPCSEIAEHEIRSVERPPGSAPNFPSNQTDLSELMPNRLSHTGFFLADSRRDDSTSDYKHATRFFLRCAAFL